MMKSFQDILISEMLHVLLVFEVAYLAPGPISWKADDPMEVDEEMEAWWYCWWFRYPANQLIW